MSDNTENKQASQVFDELVYTEERYVQRLNALLQIRDHINRRIAHLKPEMIDEVKKAMDPPGLQAIISLHQ